jgi:YD repeat-containing protein
VAFISNHAEAGAVTRLLRGDLPSLGFLAGRRRLKVAPMLFRLLRSPASRGIVSAVILLALASLLRAQQTPPFVYAYDEAGRLIGMADATGNTTTYTYDALGNIVSITRGSAAVSIIGFTPRSGPVGTSVTIVGAGFSATAAQNTVTFNGMPATVVTATTNRLVAVVPAGATTGPIRVTSPAGSAVSATPFTVGLNGAPSISGFTPSIGTAGSAVAITGVNFEPVPGADKAAFNGHLGTVSSATATTLQTVVPPSATSGRVTVTTPNGRATSTGDFFVPPSSYTAADVEMTGRMAIGETRAMTISQAGKIGLIVFDGAAGQRISLKVGLGGGLSGGDCDSVSIRRPDGAYLVSSASVCGSSDFIDRQTLPVGGTYLITVDPAGTSTGTATLTLYDVPPDATATLVPGGSPVTVTTTTPGQNARVTFSGAAGQRVALNVSFGSGLYPGLGSCNYVSIQNPDGTPLLSQTLECGSSYFTDVRVLPTTGIYTITVNPGELLVGSATLTLYDVPPDTTAAIVPGGSPVTVTTTTPAQNARVTFSGTAGQRVALNVSFGSGLYPSLGSCNYVSIQNPDGTPLLNQTLECGSSYFSDVRVLPATGVYVITVNPGGLLVGSATLTLYAVQPDTTAAITAGGSPVIVTTTTPGQNAQVSFSGTAGQRVALNVSFGGGLNMGSCNYVSIRNPDGTPLLNETLTCSSSYFTDVRVLPATGAYIITVNPGGLSVGSATLTLYNVPPDATATIVAGGPPVTVTTTTPGQNARVSFGGGTPAAPVTLKAVELFSDGFESGDISAWEWNAAGRRVALNVSFGAGLNTGSCNYVSILNPNGTPLLNETLTCSTSYFSDLVTLAVTGPHTIIVNPGGLSFGIATLTLYEVPEDATGSIMVGGPAVTVTAAVPGQNAVVTFNGLAGQSVTVRMTGNTIGQVTVTLRRPDGSTQVSFFSVSTSFNLAPQTLPVTGTYTIFVDPNGSRTGSINVAATSP